MASSASDWRTVLPVPSQHSGYKRFTKPIEKSPNDERQYRVIQLENGLEATLVSDPTGDKAAASLDVAVGHLYDPDDMPGLAHFCEHLLFMGTDQFPRENEYSEYLAKNSGSSNAFTGTSNTNYYFDVGNTALAGALTRFSAFFHSPLFSPSCTSRELNAVNSEHKKNHQNDIWRIFQINKHLSKEGHVWRKFGSGNRETLERAAKAAKRQGALSENASVQRDALAVETAENSRSPSPASSEMEADGGAIGRETRRRLVEWWSKEYCASRMRLCVIGKESLDELTEMVAPLFSPIPNRGCDPLPMLHEHPFGPNESGTLVSVQTVMDFLAIEISFPLPYQPPHWKHKPGDFLAHLLGHEGPGSLHAYLKKKGWVTSLSASPQNLARGFAMFKITIHLTKDGFRNHRELALATFKYLSMLRSSQFAPWKQEEICMLAQTRFRFQEKTHPDDYAQWISQHMAWPVPRDLLLVSGFTRSPWGSDGKAEADMRQMLEGLRATTGRAVLMGKAAEYASLSQNTDWQTEPVYGTQFRVERFDASFLVEAEAPNDLNELFLPGPNEFIPKNLDVDKKVVAETAKRPFLIRETPRSITWHKKDDTFWVPRASARISILSDVANVSARSSVMTRLWADLVTDSLGEYTYDAELAGLRYHVNSDLRGMYLSVSGYNDKLPVLAHHVLERLGNLKIDPERFAVIQEEVARGWKNIFMRESYSIAMYYQLYAVTRDQWLLEEKLAEISRVKPADVENHIRHFLSKTFTEILIVGNVDKEDAVKFAEMVEKTTGSAALDPGLVSDRALLLPPGSDFVWSKPVINPNEPNSSLAYYMQLGDCNDPRTRVLSGLLHQLLSEPTFNVLRTKEQLGYIVHCSQEYLARDVHVGLKIVIQSERRPPFLEERVEAFLDDMEQRISSMDPAEFDDQKNGLERKYREKLKNMKEESSRYWKYIEAGHLDFYRRTNDANLLKAITQNDVLAFFREKVSPRSPSRAKLSVHLCSQRPPPPAVSAAALSAFSEQLKQAGIEVDGETFGNEGAEPLLTDVIQHWRAKAASGAVSQLTAEKAQALLATLLRLVAEYPGAKVDEGRVKDTSVLIQDIKEFKAKLPVAPDPKPLLDWEDFPSPKL